ncbi:substrate-binding periplasmic protein [Microbacterium sp. SA39]|uniref:substrate-binding periplasmic protein n=1 Tax=Microbacterium sp. SA39 TaxID=1263625 RepID=UPI00061EE8E1|nr:ABC transporter substrate-binding protein [Microbacterium sp. SA39]KJQ55801.1 L-cystine-binding protein TcyA precursor [Microbacterium sp. SA39]
MSNSATRKAKRTNRTILMVIGIIILAIAAGFLGSVIRGGGGGSAAAADSDAGAFLADIKERGELRVGIAIAPPMTAEQEDGTLGGPNIIPLQNLADSLGVKFTPVAAEWSNIVAGLQAGRYDFAANLDATLERSLSIQFTNPVYTYQGVFIVPADSPYATSEELIAAGAVATAQGTSYEGALTELGADLLSVSNIPNALSAVNSDRVVAAFMDLPAAVGQAQADPGVKIVVPDPVIYQVDAAYGVPEDIDARSLQVVNVAITNARNNGALTRAFEAVDFLEIDNLGDLQKR